MVEKEECYVCYYNMSYNFEFDFKYSLGGFCDLYLVFWIMLCYYGVCSFDVFFNKGLFFFEEY